MTFSNECEMRKAACERQQIFYIAMKGPCDKPGENFSFSLLSVPFCIVAALI